MLDMISSCADGMILGMLGNGMGKGSVGKWGYVPGNGAVFLGIGCAGGYVEEAVLSCASVGDVVWLCVKGYTDMSWLPWIRY